MMASAVRCPINNHHGASSAIALVTPTRLFLAHIPVSRRAPIQSRGITHRGPGVVCAIPDATNARIVVQGRRMEVTPAIREYAENKVNKVLHNFEGATKEVDVTLSAAGNHGKSNEAHHQRRQCAEVTVYTLRHGIIRVEDTEDDLYAAIDLVTDKLKRKMSKLKEKAIQRKTWPGRGGPKGAEGIQDVLASDSEEPDLPIDDVASIPAEIVREKVLMLGTKMTPEEAVEQLEAVGHDFFVFLDQHEGSIKVVYRRKYGGYGMLIPTVQE